MIDSLTIPIEVKRWQHEYVYVHRLEQQLLNVYKRISAFGPESEDDDLSEVSALITQLHDRKLSLESVLEVYGYDTDGNSTADPVIRAKMYFAEIQKEQESCGE